MSSGSNDLTGQKRIGRNVGAAWLAQLPVIISGFFMPRLIDSNLDQVSLGVWDFGWSTVAYMQFLGLGLAGGLHRYVAYYRAQEDLEELRNAVSSTSIMQIGVAVFTLLMAFVVGYISKTVFAGTSAQLGIDAQWFVVLLGGALATKMVAWPARGILAGHHYWSTNFYLTAGGDVLLLAALALTLAMGGGLVDLGIVFVLSTFVIEAVRFVAARRVYGDRVYIRENMKWPMMRKILFFGIKTNIGVLPQLVVVQTVNLILAAATGPAALAVYARPLALARHVQTIVVKFANVLSSTAGSLHGLGKEKEIRRFFIVSSKFAYAMTIPQMLVLALYGDLVVRFWMGPDYVDTAIAPVLAAGMLIPYSSSAAMQVLLGLDSHGKAGLGSLVVSSIVLGIGISIAFVVGWSPLAAAVVAGASLTAGPGLMVCIAACRRLQIGAREFFRSVLALPIVCNVIFGLIIAIPRVHDSGHLLVESLAALTLGGCVLVALYWWRLLDSGTKRNVLRKFGVRQPAT